MVPDRRNGSYRGYVAPVIGGLIAFAAIGAGAHYAAIWIDRPSAYPPYRESPQEAQERQPDPPLAKILKPLKEYQPCRDNEGRDSSELCSQWKAADAAERASRWAWWQMVFSFFGITGLGVTLWFNRRALVVATDTVVLARNEFSVTHRPRLHVRNIVVKPAVSGPGQYPRDPFHPGYIVSGQFYVSNIGGSDAEIIESHCEVRWDLDEGLPMARPYEGKSGNNPLPETTIATGSSVPGQFSSDVPFPSVHWDRDDRSNVYVMGWVEYADTNNIRRRTAFCRQYLRRNGSARFYPVDDPDYEHEE